MTPNNNHAPAAEATIHALWKVTKVVLDTLDFNQVVQKICDSLLSELGYLHLGYRIIVLSLFDEKQNGLQRIALSQTTEAQAAMSVSTIPFHEILIPLTEIDNYCVRAFLDQKSYVTHDWKDILSPPLQPDDARTNQRAAGIKTSMVYPVVLKGKSVGIVIFSIVKEESEVSPAERDLIRGFTDIVGIAVQNARLYSDLDATTKRLDEANKKLVRLDKMKDEFVSLASHELRTPMTAIKSYTWMVLNNKAGELTPKGREYLDVVFQSTERLIRLVNEMLDISRIESGRIQMKIESFDLVKLLTELKEEFAARVAEKQLTLEAVCAEEAIPMTGDRGKILQIVENLVGNSVKFTPAGGKIIVTATKTDHQATIAVADTGKGIKPEDLGKLFQKFGRLEEGSLTSFAESGTGLGLYLAKQYAKLHAGDITVASEFGKGSTFTVALPLNFTSAPKQSTLETSNKGIEETG